MQNIVTIIVNPAVDKSTSVESVVAEDKLRCNCVASEPGGAASMWPGRWYVICFNKGAGVLHASHCFANNYQGRRKMPFYDYECSACGETFTRQENFEEHERRRNVKCPECGSRKTHQLVAAAHVQTSKKS